jgi:AhpD family alkylhydroperoxidase
MPLSVSLNLDIAPSEGSSISGLSYPASRREPSIFLRRILAIYLSKLRNAAHRSPKTPTKGDCQVTTESWPNMTRDLNVMLRDLRAGSPDVMKAFSAMAQSALAPKVLDTKTKELIALAIGVATRCDDCIAYHAKAAVEQGASNEEILETLAMTVYMGAGPSVMYASHALQAFEQFSQLKQAQKTPKD